MFPRQWLRDKPISTGVIAGFLLTSEKTAPVSGFPCVPTERPVPGTSPHLLPAKSRAQDQRTNKELKISIHELAHILSISLLDTIFAWGNCQGFSKLYILSIVLTHCWSNVHWLLVLTVPFYRTIWKYTRKCWKWAWSAWVNLSQGHGTGTLATFLP